MKVLKKKKPKYITYINGGVIQSKPTEGEEKTDYGYKSAMDYLVSKKGGTSETYENLMNAIAYHETGASQRMNPSAIQEVANSKGELVREGVGRGMFMFEAGESKGGITAVNRTYKEFKDAGMDIPDWLSKAWKEKSLDASTLNEEQQRVLFIGNYLQHPKADLGAFAKGDVSIRDFWGGYHHAGGDSTNYDSFDSSYEAYLKSLQE